MTKILSQIGQDREVSMTFKAGEIIPFGTSVYVSAAGVVSLATDNKAIGWAVPDDVTEAVNEAEQYNADDLVIVKLKGEMLQVIAGVGGVAVGNFTKNGAAGKYVAETIVTTKTVDTEGVALTAASADGYFDMVRLD